MPPGLQVTDGDVDDRDAVEGVRFKVGSYGGSCSSVAVHNSGASQL
jgi:hypothetical protein